jgi:hypothetical protein
MRYSEGLILVKARTSPVNFNPPLSRVFGMKQTLEILSETSAAVAAILWFMSARVRLRKRGVKRGLAIGTDDPHALLRMVYEQSRWSAWAAIAAGLAAIFAIAEGFAR